MSSFGRVPVIDVNTDNLREIWPSMILAMSSSTFIALDTELSGLGDRKLLNAKSVEDRYKNIAATAATRSILSLGVACFKQVTPTTVPSQSQSTDNHPDSAFSTQADQSESYFMVQTYNITLLCEEEYLVEPASLRFLVQHGFDFNKQYEKGISYYRGPDKESKASFQSIRHLFVELVSMEIPIVLHNGLVDMMFLYQNLYASLPVTSATFLADLVDLFPGGVIDTKYVTEFEHLMPASYLEYVFRKCQRDAVHVGCRLQFPPYPSSYAHVTYRDCRLEPPRDLVHSSPEQLQQFKATVCEQYAGHGWCNKGKHCSKSHNIDSIIDIDELVKDRKSHKRKRRQKNKDLSDSSEPESDVSVSMETDDKTNLKEVESDTKDRNSVNGVSVALETVERSGEVTLCEKCSRPMDKVPETVASGGHRAGYDAFMTGMIFSVYLYECQTRGTMDKLVEWRNKLYLCGKDYPLSVSKSTFVKQSKEHLEKIARIRNSQPK